MKSKTRNFIAKIVAAVIVTAVVFFAFSELSRTRNELEKIKANTAVAATGEPSYQITLTKQELKEYFSQELEKLKEYGIPARNVENIVEIRYEYRDSVRYRDTLVWVYDTIGMERIAPFSIDGNCYSIEGFVFDDTVEVLCHQVYDDILISLYREKRKCLFERQKVKAIAISGCSGDTIAVRRNVKVKRKGRD